MKPLTLAAVVFVLSNLVLAAPPTAIELGGARKIRGEVTQTAEKYTVTVSFLPVRMFDASTNEEINRELGQEYAIRVLATHLAPDASELQFETAHDELVEAKLSGQRFTITVRWPKDKVRVLAASSDKKLLDMNNKTVEEKSKPGAEKPRSRVVSTKAFTSKFFTAKQDHLDTIAAITATNSSTIKKAFEGIAEVPEGERRRALARRVAEVEERGITAFDALAKEVKDDPNLLDLTERPEVQEAVLAARTQLIKDLKAVLGDTDNTPVAFHVRTGFEYFSVNIDDPKPTDKLPFKEIKIEKPYDKFLTSNQLLMEVAGAILVDDGDGNLYLIGVGKTILKDGSADDLLRAEKVCKLKAHVAAIGERDGAQISFLKRVEDKIVIVKDSDGKEITTSVSERLKVTKEKIEGVTKGLAVIGRWRSEDGKAYYIAVGGKVPSDITKKK
jgi:hypothetical protein